MAGDHPRALRRTQRRRRQHDLDQMPKTPTPASTRKSSRASGAAPKKPATRKAADKAAGKAARTTKTKASTPESASVTAADDATDDSVTLVDDADDSITALDFEIPISSSNNNKRKRPSTASQNGEGNQQAIKKVRRQTNNSSNETNNSSQVVHILPLRTQILDDHIKRRIRRNGLSAEMNDAYGEKRARRQKTLEELRRARDELRDRDAEIERLRELTALFGDGSSQHQNHQELEMELSRLREQVLGRRRGANEDVELTSSPPVVTGGDRDDDDGWGGMDGISDGGRDAGDDFGAHDFDDDEEFGETSLAELESGGTPGQHRHHHHRQQQRSTAKRPSALRLHGPTLTPPSTSPTKPASSPARQIHSSSGSNSTASCDSGVQAVVGMSATDAASQVSIPDPAMDDLHEELSTLRAEVSSLNETLLERDALRARVGEKLALHQLSSAESPPPGQAEDQDQDLELQLDIVLQDLAEKTDRLGELSALVMPASSPGNSTDSKDATAQLSTALQDVRETLADLDPTTTTTTLPQSAAPVLVLAATRLRELDNNLRQRTAAHDAELSTLTTDLAASRAREAEKAAQVTNLSADVAHLADTIGALREEIDILQSASTSQQTDLDSARDAALQQKTAAAEAEAKLAEAVGRVASLSQQLAERESQLRGRDGEVERLKGELAAAGVTITKLRGQSRDVVRAMRAQMLAALRVGEGFLGDEGMTKTEEGVDVIVGGGMDTTARDRSDDSGLGLGEDQGEGEGLQLV